MTGRERIQCLAAAGAAVAALAATAAAPASAGAPVGTVVATDVPRPLMVDHETGSVAYDVAPGVVRVIDTATSASRDVDVAAACPQYGDVPLVTAAADGAVLLTCAEQETVAGRVYTTLASRILDTSDWTVKVPVGLRGPGRSLVRAGIVYSHHERSGDWYQVSDWRTGRIVAGNGASCDRWRSGFEERRGSRTTWLLTRCDGSGRTVLPASPERVENGYASWRERGLDNTTALTAYLPGCRLLARWQVGAIDVVEHLPGEALLIGSADHGGGPLTETRVSLAGLCDRTASRWGLRASAGGRTVTARLRGGAVADAATGADTAPLPRTAAPPRLGAAAGARLRLRTATSARSLRWRLAGGRWKNARGSGRTWTATLPARVRGSRTVELQTGLTGGGELRHTLNLTLTGAKR